MIPLSQAGTRPNKRGRRPRRAAYRQSREPSQFTRYDHKETSVSGWLADLPAQVLDVPCGTGRFIPLLIGQGFHFAGAEFLLAMIWEARCTTMG